MEIQHLYTPVGEDTNRGTKWLVKTPTMDTNHGSPTIKIKHSYLPVGEDTNRGYLMVLKPLSPKTFLL